MGGSRVLVAMSGGVDSSVAAARLLEQGYDVTGVTLKLWGGESDSGCCSVADVEDARRVAAQLGMPHYVFNFTEEFDDTVVEPYVDAHRAGRTPNPCVECNRSIKFGRLLERADALGFAHVATGHHARVTRSDRGTFQLRRGADAAKDQSYVLYMLGQRELGRTLFPVGDLTKADVRAQASRLGLRTAAKPESMDVCFITRGGRESFLAARVPARAGAIVDTDGATVGGHGSIATFTVGQRRGLGVATGERRYVVDVDARTATVTIGAKGDLLRDAVEVRDVLFTDGVPSSCALDGPDARARRTGRGDALREHRSVRRTRSRGSRPARSSRSTTATCSWAAGSLPDRHANRQAPRRGQPQHLVAARHREQDRLGLDRLAAAPPAGGPDQVDRRAEPGRHRARTGAEAEIEDPGWCRGGGFGRDLAHVLAQEEDGVGQGQRVDDDEPGRH